VHPGSPDNEERRLLVEYETATCFYSWAVRELGRQRGLLSYDDYQKLLKVAGHAHDECERSRIALRDFRSSTEHDSLGQEYQAAVQNLRSSIRDLVVLVDDNSATDSDFNLAHWRIRTARRACDVARKALEHHQAEPER
jgi:hypothetical protein